MNAKRYVYTIDVFAGKVYNDVIDIQEETYEFTFYVMGTLGIRAGINASFHIGIFSTKLASVGFSAEVGAYARLWGYFYYELHYTASQGRTQAYCGALYIEVGVYLEVNFEAQAFGGTFSTEVSLYENEWPLWSVGNRDSIQDFTTAQEEMPEVLLKQYIRSTMLSDDIFSMRYLDLKEGEEEDAIYSDEENFEIKMSNDAFRYDPKTNMVTVSPGFGQVKLEGEMTITWKNYPLAFTSEPIQRKVTLYWDNLRDGYVIVPFTNGGSYLPIIVKKYEAEVTQPEDPVRAGYVFGGWYQDKGLTKPYTFPKTMPDKDAEIYAAWTPATDTAYRVEHYQQVLGSSQYRLAETDALQGTTESRVTPLTKTYLGYSSPAQEELVILADGSAVMRYYYDLKIHTVTFMPGEVGGESEAIELRYGANITAPQFGAKGYLFKGWNTEVAKTMGDEDLSYTAQWEKDTNTKYRVEYYLQQPDGSSKMEDVAYLTGSTGEELTDGALRTGAYLVDEAGLPISAEARFAVLDGIEFDRMTSGGKNLTELGAPAVILGNGKTVVKIYYLRAEHTVTFVPENGAKEETKTLYYGAALPFPQLTRPGYDFVGWQDAEGNKAPETMGTADATYTAQWTARTDTPYSVEYHVQQPDGKDKVYANAKQGETDTVLTAESLRKDAQYATEGGVVYKKMTVNGKAAEQATISGEGDTAIALYYERLQYKVTFVPANGEEQSRKTLYYGAQIPYPALTRAGYDFTGWQDAAGNAAPETMGTADAIYTAQWLPHSDTPYRVEHYVMNTDGSYAETASSTTYLKGTSDAPLQTLAALKDAGLEVAGGIAYDHAEVAGERAETAAIAADGSLVVKLYYARTAYPLSWDFAPGEAQGDYTSGKVHYGAVLVAPQISRPGYTYRWDRTPAKTMPAAATTYTAVYTGNPYTVIFNSNTGTGSMESQKFVNGTEQKLTANAFAKPGYDFAGWAISAGGAPEYADGAPVLDLIQEYDGSITLYACWAAHPYTITYALGGGANSPTNPATYTVEDASLTLGAPTRAGYTFAGWYANAEFSGDAVTEIPAGSSGDVSLFARWTAHTDTPYTVEHRLQGIGNEEYVLTDTQTLTGTTDTQVTPALMAYEGFTAPAAQTVTIAGNGSTLVEYRYTRNLYTLTFSAGEGTLPGEATITAPYEQAIALPSPTWEGYGFGGWYADAACAGAAFENQTMPALNVTLYAKWMPGQYGYTVNHYKMNVSGSGYELVEVASGTEAMGANVSPTPRYYDGFTAPAQQTITMTADPAANVVNYNYTRNQYNLAWDFAGGTAPEGYTSGAVFYDALITAPQLVRTGYSYTWNERPLLRMPAKELSYTASWTANEYTVSFDATGGSSAAERTVTYDTTYGALPEVTRTGYTFAGWYTARSGGSKVEATTLMTTAASHTLYAHWNTIPYTLSYAGVEDATNDNPTGYTVEDAITLKQPSRIGYTFTGWTAEGQQTPIRNLTIPAGSIGDKTYTANWSVNQYAITFMTHDGVYKTITQDYGTAVTAPEAPTRRGYRFAGWDQKIPATMPAKGVTITAKWELITYAIRYENLLDGQNNPSNPTSYAVTSKTLPLYGATRTGYTFAGWYAAKDFTGSSLSEIQTGGIGDKTLYAKWTANAYKVVFSANAKDATGKMEAQEFVYDVAEPLTANGFARAGYTFSGWATSAAGSKAYADKASAKNLSSAVDGVVTLYALWTPVRYELTYLLDGGTLAQKNPASYTVETETFLLANPAKIGYTFLGWTVGSESEPSTAMSVLQGSRGNKTFTAHWKINQYTVTFDPAGGSQVAPLTLDYGAAVKAPAEPTRAGYLFAGWTPALPETMPAKHLSVTAEWTPVTYTVIYGNMEGAENDPENPTEFTVESGILTLNPPTKTGYGFGGWYLDAGLTKPVTNFTTSTTPYNLYLYAKWEANSYSVTFDNNLKAGHSTKTQMFRYDTAQALTTNPFTNTGYTFAGWTTAQNSGTVNYKDNEVVKNLATAGNVTLYAVWTPVRYTISYSLGVGATGQSNPTGYTIETAEIRLADPTGQKAGYQFLGWYEGETKVTSIQHGTTGNRSLTAKWAHGGVFSLSRSSSSGGKTTYVITRTIPAGAEATSDVQHVYYRTLNGTAIGGTAEAIHFLHVGGPEVFATFTSSDGNGSTKTFTVEGENANAVYNKNGIFYITNGYTEQGVYRSYSAEIYQVVSTQGNCTGTLGNRSVSRVLGSSNTVSEALLTSWRNIATATASGGGRSGIEIHENSGGGYNGTRDVGLSGRVFTSNGSALDNYIDATTSQMRVQLRELKATDDGWRMWRFVLFNTRTGDVQFSGSKNSNRLPNLPGVSRAGFVYGISRDKDNGDSYSVTLPAPAGGLSASGTGYGVEVSHTLDNLNNSSSGYSVIYNKGETCSITLGAYNKAAQNSSYWFNSGSLWSSPYDTTEPRQIGMAPMAFGKYKAGDTVTVSVIYDEIVHDKGSASLGSISGIPLSNVSYTSGLGTTVLTFTGTAAEDFDVTADFNNTLIDATPVSGTVYDMVG